MKNLEQIRAKNAFEAVKEYKSFKGDGDGDIVKKVPTQIRDNGFLAAMAFAMYKGKGYEDVFNAIITHLPDVNCSFGLPYNEGVEAFFKKLVEKDSDTLRAITAEALAYLNYLRRFAKGS